MKISKTQMYASHLYVLYVRQKTVHSQGSRDHMLEGHSLCGLVCNRAHIVAILMACAVISTGSARGHEAKCCSKCLYPAHNVHQGVAGPVRFAASINQG
jgi:hypothetical protein